ncbi:MAG: M23 family metallopeptidase [Bacilli bacterium]|nr:M23 family metallopeptidase [Bacilli bacterium]
MKKVGLYFVVAIISVAIFLLGFSYETPIQPYTAYQVYLNGELLGMIDSKQELEDYINSQGSTIKANVQDYQKKLEIIDVVEELFKSIADEEFVNLSIKDKVHYLIDHKTGLKISDIKTDNLIKYLEDGYDAYSEEEINEMRDYVEKNEIYLFADKVYTPNGIDIKKVKTYKNDKITIPDMYLKIIERESCTIAGYRFTINDGENQKIVYVTDKAMFQEAVDTMASIFVGETEYKRFKEKTQSPIDNTGSIIEKVYLQEDITYKAVNIDTSEKIYTNTSDLAKYLLYGNEYEEYKVKVSEGDSITTLAFANEISVDEFLISNQEYTNKDNLLYPGKEVVIAKTNPQINLVVETYTVEDKVSNFATVEEYDSNMTQGNSVVTQEGETGIERVSQNVKWVNGQITYIEPVGKETIKMPVNKVVTVGTKVIPNVGSTTSWGWPTNSGYTISSPFGYRINPVTGARELHSGIDISGTGYNSPVYATNNGTIKEIQSHWSYGNYILIDHGNGYYSLYAHMAKFSPELNVGSIVERGQQIGYVGMTGTATGPHLHYEIRNCERYACVTNPLDYYQ